jgi:cell division protein FtsQ
MAAHRRYIDEPTEHTIPGWGIFAITLCVMLVIGFGWMTYKHSADWLANMQQGFYNMTADAGLRLADINIMGNHELATDTLQEKIAATPGAPLLAVDIKDIQSKLSEVNLVRGVRVSRLWPDRLIVQIDERTPIALWQKDQKLSPIDQDGVNLTMLQAKDFGDLPVVVGDNAPKYANNLLDAVAGYQDLKSALRGATYVSDRRWDLFLKSGMQVKLPEGDAAAGIKRFMAFNDEHDVLSKPIAVVDLRLDDRVVIKPIAPAEDKSTDKKKTKGKA